MPGFRPDFGWIALPVLGDDGQPVHERGVVSAEPGLYFVGLLFQYALTSSLVGASVGMPNTSPSTSCRTESATTRASLPGPDHAPPRTAVINASWLASDGTQRICLRTWFA
ncbi:MAG TPA: hypothetical protein VFH02_03780, partial [Jiangellaceae bacterium]|nr:hypothetical protein [Jiangellaceae bacterium]